MSISTGKYFKREGTQINPVLGRDDKNPSTVFDDTVP
jgi:hypothetical protein